MLRLLLILFFFFFNDTATTEIYTLSLHDALPISDQDRVRQRPVLRFQTADRQCSAGPGPDPGCNPERRDPERSEEHTSELQSPCNLVCRLLLEKKKKIQHARV